VQGLVSRILFEKRKIFAGQLLNFFRKLTESLPEQWRRAMRLKV
jgi:hypothetical protein